MHPNDTLTHIAIANESANTLYVLVYWRDHSTGSMYLLPLQDNHALAAQSVTVFNLEPELVLDGSTDESTIYVCYSRWPFEAPVLPDDMSEEEFVKFLADKGILCVISKIEYRHE